MRVSCITPKGLWCDITTVNVHVQGDNNIDIKDGINKEIDKFSVYQIILLAEFNAKI